MIPPATNTAPELEHCRHCGAQVPKAELKPLPGVGMLACKLCCARIEVTGHKHAKFIEERHGAALQRRMAKA